MQVWRLLIVENESYCLGNLFYQFSKSKMDAV